MGGKFQVNFISRLALVMVLLPSLTGCGGETARVGTATVPATTLAAATTVSVPPAISAPVLTAQPVASAPATISTLVASQAAVTTVPATTVAVTTQAAPSTVPASTQAPATTSAAAGTATAAPVLSGPASFAPDLAFRHVQKLAGEIGVRAAGTAGERAAADYIESYFKGLGLKTERAEFDYTITRDQGSTVAFQDRAAQNVTLKGNALNLSGNGRVNGLLSYAGLGLDGQIPRDSLKGKIALLQRGQIRFSEKVENATQAGAIGVVVYNNIDGALDSATLDRQVDVPVLGISQADGERLREELRANKNLGVDLNVNIGRTQIKSANVAATRPANAPEARIIIIGGHYDSVPAGPGANDNASGTAIVLELARVLQNQYPNYELRFVAFGAEEVGLVGSASYVARLTETERKRTQAMINIDMVSVGQQWLLGGTPDLTRLALAASTEFGAGNTQILPEDSQAGSDHYSFQQAGIPVLFLNRESDPNYHKPGDTPDKVRPASLEQVGKITLRVLEGVIRS